MTTTAARRRKPRIRGPQTLAAGLALVITAALVRRPIRRNGSPTGFPLDREHRKVCSP
jgi:hypothetical protein